MRNVSHLTPPPPQSHYRCWPASWSLCGGWRTSCKLSGRWPSPDQTASSLKRNTGHSDHFLTLALRLLHYSLGPVVIHLVPQAVNTTFISAYINWMFHPMRVLYPLKEDHLLPFDITQYMQHRRFGFKIHIESKKDNMQNDVVLREHLQCTFGEMQPGQMSIFPKTLLTNEMYK